MNVAYTTRGFELSEQIKKYTEEKLRKILSLDELIDVALTLEQSRGRYKAELLVHNRTARFAAIESTPDVFKSINAVIDKAQKQLKKHKEKLINRKRLAPNRGAKLNENMATGERVINPRVIRARKQDIKPMSQEEALMQIDSRNESFLLFRDTRSDRIRILFRRKDGNYGLIDSEI
jgi:putative sigma-54 modulation protein